MLAPIVAALVPSVAIGRRAATIGAAKQDFKEGKLMLMLVVSLTTYP